MSPHPLRPSRLPGVQILGNIPWNPGDICKPRCKFPGKLDQWKVCMAAHFFFSPPDQMCSAYGSWVYSTAGESMCRCTDLGIYLSSGLRWIRSCRHVFQHFEMYHTPQGSHHHFRADGVILVFFIWLQMNLNCYYESRFSLITVCI